MEWLTVFDWLSPLLQLFSIGTGGVQLEGTAQAIAVLERAGISVTAPMLVHTSGTYLFTVKRKDHAKALRVAARAGVEVW